MLGTGPKKVEMGLLSLKCCCHRLCWLATCLEHCRGSCLPELGVVANYTAFAIRPNSDDNDLYSDLDYPQTVKMFDNEKRFL